jgi:hypothetical protein
MATPEKKTKCTLCKKKLGLVDMTITCKCGAYYCSLHRVPESHNCNYNYYDESRASLLKVSGGGPVVADKLDNRI